MVHNCKLRLRLCALREACPAPNLTLAASLVVWFALSAIAAPFVDEGAHRLLDAAPKPPPHLSGKFLEAVRGLLAGAAQEAVTHLEPFDRVGSGQASRLAYPVSNPAAAGSQGRGHRAKPGLAEHYKLQTRPTACGSMRAP